MATTTYGELQADTVRPTYWEPGRSDPRLMFKDTGRPVDERHGTHVVIANVFDPVAHADAILAAIDAVTSYRDHFRAEAETIRGRTPYLSWSVGTYYSKDQADSSAADLQRCHGDAGRRWEVHPITNHDHCRYCRQPIVYAAGEWRHHNGLWHAECKRDADGTPIHTLATPVARSVSPNTDL